MMDREQIAAHLKEEIDEARAKVSRALLKWENGRRCNAQQPELPPSAQVWLPTGPDADLRLLTLTVWSMRWRVSLVWLLDAVLTRYRTQRRLPVVKSPEELSLGLSASMLTGDAARSAVEERLAREFPNGENMRASRQPSAPPMPDLNGDDFVALYVDAVKAGASKRPAHYKRPYRGSVV
jgi:hypothetical protein